MVSRADVTWRPYAATGGDGLSRKRRHSGDAMSGFSPPESQPRVGIWPWACDLASGTWGRVSKQRVDTT